MTSRRKLSSLVEGSVQVQPEEVRQELDRICSYSGFASSPTLQRFLRFTVEKVLEGDTEEIKEYTIGSQVLGRGISFDPARSSIVRTHAFNLRTRLNAFYNEKGAIRSFRIVYEPGRYVPVFADKDATVPRAETVRHLRPLLVQLSLVDVPAAGEPLNTHLRELRSELIQELVQRELFRVMAEGASAASDFEVEAWPSLSDGRAKLQMQLIDHRQGGFYVWTGTFEWRLHEFCASALARRIRVEVEVAMRALIAQPTSALQ